MSTPWRYDPPGSEARIHRNLRELVGELRRSARARENPTVELARTWHRAIFDGVELPVDYYAGGVRDLDPDEPELVNHEVMWGGQPATAAAEVWQQLRDFEQAAAQGTATIDAAIPRGTLPPDAAALDSVLALSAALHTTSGSASTRT